MSSSSSLRSSVSSSAALEWSSSRSSRSSQSSAAAPERGIKLRRLPLERYVDGLIDAFRFQVVAYDNVLMPREIFRFERKPFVSNGSADQFVAVASPVALEEEPAGTPNDTDVIRYYRLPEIDIVLRSQHEADAAWQDLQEEVGLLVTTLNLMDDLGEEEIATFGEPPVGGSSSSI